MLLPIVEKNKLIDFIHTSDLFEKKVSKKILVIEVGIHGVNTCTRSF